MNPSTFVATYGAAADQAAGGTGLSRWTILTQWAFETGWCASNSGCPWSNLAGITCHGGCPCNSAGFCRYSSSSAFASDYIAVLHNGYYPDVLASAHTTLRTQMHQLGSSPWAGSHYDAGSGPGTSLMGIYQASLQGISGIGLDASLASPPPAPPPVYPPPPTPASPDLVVPLLLLGTGVLAIGYAYYAYPGLFTGLERQAAGLVHRVREG